MYYNQYTCPLGSTPYIVKPGDTFWLISQRLGVPVQNIIMLNPGVNPYRLMIGQQICIPTMPKPHVFKFPCSITLLPTEPSLRAGGSLWIREDEFTVTGYSTIFAATFLPEPSSLGNFNAYIGRIIVTQPHPEPPIIHSILLKRSEFLGQQVTWAGTRILPEGPTANDIAEVLPFNSELDITGTAILRGNFKKCLY